MAEEAGGKGEAMPISATVYNKMYDTMRAVLSYDLLSSRAFPKDATGKCVFAGGKEVDADDDDELEIKQRLAQFIWLSYRQGFGGLGTAYDTGWGCVHRAGQMLLAEVLRRHLPQASRPEILAYFRDVPEAPFSIQRIARRGEAYGKPVGQWFAPSTVGNVIRDLVKDQASLFASLPLRVICVTDQQVRCREVMENADGGVLLLVPFMFGMECVSGSNEQLLLDLLALPHCVGILGGQPRYALLYVAAKGRRLLYLDPHRVQPAYLDDASAGMTVSPKCQSIPISKIDPSSLLAFYSKGRSDTVKLLCSLQQVKYCDQPYRIFDMQGFARHVEPALPKGAAEAPAGHPYGYRPGGASPVSGAEPAASSAAQPPPSSPPPATGGAAGSSSSISTSPQPAGAAPPNHPYALKS